MTKHLFILIILVIAFSGFSQEDFIQLKINLLDQQTGSQLEGAKLRITDVQDGSIFRKDVNSGDTLILPFDEGKVWRFSATASGFDKVDTLIRLLSFKKEVKKGKVVDIDLLFQFDGQLTGIVDINATYKPAVKFRSDTLSVSDYVLLDEKHQLLLTYPKRLDKGSELIWYVDEEIKGRREVQGVALELIIDFRSNIYLRCENVDYMVLPGVNIELYKTNTRDLDNFTLPILDTLDENNIYFSNYNAYYPAYDYLMVDRSDTIYTDIRHIEDELMMEQYRSEYKWADVRTKLWAWDMEAETGIDREVWVGANVFTNSIYYDPPIGNMYKDVQDLYVFDFYKDKIVQYDGYSAEAIDSVEISFHLKPRKTGWEQEVIQDPITKKLYTFYDNAGFMEISEVNPTTGELGPKLKLFYRYVENIQIHNGFVYYIYRPYESPQKKYLYFEELNENENELSTDR